MTTHAQAHSAANRERERRMATYYGTFNNQLITRVDYNLRRRSRAIMERPLGDPRPRP